MRLFPQCKVYTWRIDTKNGRLSSSARAVYVCIAPRVWFEEVNLNNRFEWWSQFREDNFLYDAPYLHRLTPRQVKRLCGKSLKEMTKMFHRMYARHLKDRERALKLDMSIAQSKAEEIAKRKRSFWSNKNNKARKGK